MVGTLFLRFFNKNLDEKFSFAVILFKLRSAYVSEDYKKTKTEVYWEKKFNNFFFLESFENYFYLVLNKIGAKTFSCSKIEKKNYVRGALPSGPWRFWIESP